MRTGALYKPTGFPVATVTNIQSHSRSQLALSPPRMRLRLSGAGVFFALAFPCGGLGARIVGPVRETVQLDGPHVEMDIINQVISPDGFSRS